MTSTKDSVPTKHYVPRNGDWLTQDHRHHQAWLQKTINHVDSNPTALVPVLQEFQDLIENNTRLYIYFTTMFEQIPHKHPYFQDPEGHVQCRDYQHLLKVINHVITTAPAWSDNDNKVELVGVPLNAVCDWSMGTRSGFAAFMDPLVNAQLKKVLNVWGAYLMSPASASVLGTDKNGWFGPSGLRNLTAVANIGQTRHTFEEMFHCDEEKDHHGYTSWDDFFTRLWKDGMRPVVEPEDDDVIANACESITYKVARDVGAREKFWVKGQPYSVMDMLAHSDEAAQFVGGTIYQAFLSALSYHRWHSPVSGTIVKTLVVDGTYFSEPVEDFTQGKPVDPHGQTTMQEYLSATATRGIIYIQADNPKIGLMAFIGVGMVEVSTCDITVKVGERVKKGDQLGMFHFGGSTHCVMFRKGVELTGFPEVGGKWNVPVRSKLAQVV